MRLHIFAAFLLLALSFSLAQTPYNSGTEALAGQNISAGSPAGQSFFEDMKKQYESDPAFKAKADAAIAKWRESVGENTSLEQLGDVAVIVVGSELNGPELGALELLKKENPALAGLKPMDDSDSTLKSLENSPKPVILVGGPSQNRLARIFQERGWLESDTHDFYGQFVINYGKAPSGAPIVVLSDGRGYKNLVRSSASFSPLAALMPEKYVPLAATGISVTILALPSLLALLSRFFPNLLRGYLGKYLQFIGKGDKQISEKFMGLTILGFRFKVREFISIFLAALVFALAIAYTFTGPKIDFAFVAIINLFIASFLYFAREIARLLIAHWQKLHTEFHVWPAGSFLTLLSAFLGNTCNATYYVLEEKDEKGVRKSALIKIFVALATLCFAILFFILNLLFPAPVLQMFFVSGSTLAAVETLPFKPLPGTGIRKWSTPAWLVVFLIAWGAYLLMNFVL